MAKWVITYVDGSTFSDEDGEPHEAPRLYVQCIAVADISCGNYILAEQDFYCWHDDQWIPHDKAGLMQYLLLPGKEKIVLFGFWTARDKYAAMRVAAQRDERLPARTANAPRQPEGL